MRRATPKRSWRLQIEPRSPSRTTFYINSMKTHGHISAENLMTLEAYAKYRREHHGDIMRVRQMRSVSLGEHMHVQFESEYTIRYQIQEMLRIERIFEEKEIQAEIDAYAPLVPEGSNWKATVLLQYPDPQVRRAQLARLIGVEDRLFIQTPASQRLYAIADEDLARENLEKTSAVHFVRFELSQEMVADVKAGARVTLGCDHAHFVQSVELAPHVLSSLVQDLH